MDKNERLLSILREKVELLTGERAGGERRAAIYPDVKGLLELRTFTVDRLTASHAAGATPTKAEFDKLVDDVFALRTLIVKILGTI